MALSSTARCLWALRRYRWVAARTLAGAATLAFLAWATSASVRAHLPLPGAIRAAEGVGATHFDPVLWPSRRFTLEAFPLVLAVAAAARRSFSVLAVVLADLPHAAAVTDAPPLTAAAELQGATEPVAPSEPLDRARSWRLSAP